MKCLKKTVERQFNTIIVKMVNKGRFKELKYTFTPVSIFSFTKKLFFTSYIYVYY